MPAASLRLFAGAVLELLRIGDRPHRDGAFGQARYRRHEGDGAGGHDQAPVLDLFAPGYGDDPPRRVDGLDSVEARAHRQVLEYGRQPQLAELRALGPDGDQVELGERLLARAGLEQEHLDARVAAAA